MVYQRLRLKKIHRSLYTYMTERIRRFDRFFTRFLYVSLSLKNDWFLVVWLVSCCMVGSSSYGRKCVLYQRLRSVAYQLLTPKQTISLRDIYRIKPLANPTTTTTTTTGRKYYSDTTTNQSHGNNNTSTSKSNDQQVEMDSQCREKVSCASI